MPDWSASMQRTYEYYVVDPETWRDTRLITVVKTASINRDSEAQTLGSATLDVTENLGECYIRIYLVTIQNGITERHALGTFMVQTPSTSFDGRVKTFSVDAYTPLLELKEKNPPLGYYVEKSTDEKVTRISDLGYRLARENARAPVVGVERKDSDIDETDTLTYDFVADPSDTWLTFLIDFLSCGNKQFDLDEYGRILFAPRQDIASMQPVWTFNDDNSSILYPDVTLEQDLYNVPNVVEVIYSKSAGYMYVKVVNDDPESPISTVNRGREITYRLMDPDLPGMPSENYLAEYANQVLRTVSSLEHKVSYTHGYCPVRVGDCVRLNYTRAGLNNVKAKVISQTIKCDPGCPVTEKAVYTVSYWNGGLYTVQYDANGGENAPEKQLKTHGGQLTLSRSVPTKQGKSFKQWNTSADGNGTTYKPGGVYDANYSTTLYAIWEEVMESCL